VPDFYIEIFSDSYIAFDDLALGFESFLTPYEYFFYASIKSFKLFYII
jgi:hypothetical protein